MGCELMKRGRKEERTMVEKGLEATGSKGEKAGSESSVYLLHFLYDN